MCHRRARHHHARARDGWRSVLAASRSSHACRQSGSEWLDALFAGTLAEGFKRARSKPTQLHARIGFVGFVNWSRAGLACGKESSVRILAGIVEPSTRG